MESNPILSESGRNKSMHERKGADVIEKKLEQVPTSIFWALAGGAVALALGLAVSKNKKGWANFVGQWVPTILLLGVYSKMSKNSDTDKQAKQSFLH